MMTLLSLIGRYPPVYDKPPPRGMIEYPACDACFSMAAQVCVSLGRRTAAAMHPSEYTSLEYALHSSGVKRTSSDENSRNTDDWNCGCADTTTPFPLNHT
jgi:hypothetical protein